LPALWNTNKVSYSYRVICNLGFGICLLFVICLPYGIGAKRVIPIGLFVILKISALSAVKKNCTPPAEGRDNIVIIHYSLFIIHCFYLFSISVFRHVSAVTCQLSPVTYTLIPNYKFYISHCFPSCPILLSLDDFW
jgi:hypothetical protein